jgi:serine/threonine protein kinase/tetratricopeptide (TPR) repeat protein
MVRGWSAALKSTPMLDKTPSTIGPYQILEPLGSGGMGVVYRAWHRITGEPAAVKTVRVPHEGLLSGIRREIHALARIHHPGIVRIVAEGMEDGLPWYAMELLKGTTLRKFANLLGSSRTLPVPEVATPTDTIAPEATPEEAWDGPTAVAPGPATEQALGMHLPPRSPGAFSRGATLEVTGGGLELVEPSPPEREPHSPAAAGRLGPVLSLVRKLCVPLSFLHGEGIVHRDLKPDNVFIRPDGTPVIMDFGLISLFGGRVSREVLETEHSVLGTIAYMAPEQILGELLDARADLYSLGCILYELLAGRPPFQAPSVRETLEAHLRLAPLPPSALVLDVPKELDELVLRLLAKRPRERLGYADDVAAILAGLGADGAAAFATAPRPRAYLYRPRLAGREEALRSIEAQLDRLEGGAGGILLVGGESGVGKTRLAMEAARRAKRREMQVLSGECLPQSDPEARGAESGPLHPLRRPLQKIADWCREWGWERAERIVGRHVKLLAATVPAFTALPGQEALPEPAELPAEAARFRLFAALAEIFAALAEEPRPASGERRTEETPGGSLEHSRSQLDARSSLLLILDDLQWADDLTLGFLGFLLRSGRLDRMRVLVLGTYRTDELGAAGRHVQAASGEEITSLEELLESPGVHRLRLGRLGEEAVGAMVCDMLALGAPPRRFVQHLTRHSEGNPFFVAEYMQAALAGGVLFRDLAGRWQVAEPSEAQPAEDVYRALPLPGSLRELVERRLEGLPESARRLVDAAAVVGRESNILLTWAVAKLSDESLLDALTVLTGRHVLEAVSPGRIRFVHDKLREIAYESLPSERRAELHREAAMAIEALLVGEREEHLAELGVHWERAGVGFRAREAYLAAARRAVAGFTYSQAERLYRSYLSLVSGPTEESIVARIELARDVLFFQGRNREALGEYGIALEESRLLGDRSAEALSLLGLGAVHRATGEARDALTALDRAFAIDEALGDRRQQAATLSELGHVYASQGRIGEARATWVQAFSLHRDLKNRQLEARTLGDLAELHRLEGQRFKEARILFKEALLIHRQIGDRIGEGVTRLNMAAVLKAEGRVEEARDAYREALAIHREVGDRRFEAHALCDLARLERQAGGDLSGALRLIAEAEGIAREVRDPYAEGLCLCERGHIALAQGRDAQPLLEWAQRIAAAAEAGPQSELGRVIARLERAAEARARGEELFRGGRLEDLPRGFRNWLTTRE